MSPSFGVFCLIFTFFAVVSGQEGKCTNPNNLSSFETRAIPGGRTTCTIPGTTEYAKASASITIQADVDYLHLDECNIVDGSLRFDGFRSDLDLGQFESIEHITGQLVLTRLRASKIEGFHNLKSVRKLSISDNANLTDLTVLRSLTNVTELSIENNPSLRNLDGLQGITSLRFLSLVNNKNLVDISALKDVKDFYNVQLIGNTNLRALHALEGINSTVGTLVILDNHGLTDLVGLGKVETITSNLRVENNQNLKSLRGLKVKNLETASVYVTNNPKLEDISQFSFVDHEAKEIAVISNNAALNCHRFSQLKFFPIKTSSNNLVDCPFVKTEAQQLRELNEQKVAEGPGDDDVGEDTGNFLDDLLNQIPQE